VFEVLSKIKRASHPRDHGILDRITYEMGLAQIRGNDMIRAVQKDNIVAGELLEGLMAVIVSMLCDNS